MQKPDHKGRVFEFSKRRLLCEEAELLLKARNAAAAINDRALTTGPCGVRLWIDVQIHGVASVAIGRACHKLCAIRHHNGDGVIIGVDICFHYR